MNLSQQYATLNVEDFDYELPHELIAQHPAPERRASRLLKLDAHGTTDRNFADLPELVAPGDLLIFNNTKVIKARLLGHKSSGGHVELLVERVLGAHEVLAHLRASKTPKPGSRIRLAEAFEAEVLGREDELFHLRFDSELNVLELLERHGHVPLPPYIAHSDSDDDARRYQTVYAREPGAIAAPTAGLHFDEAMLETLRQRGVQLTEVTLHVGAGTFQPVRVQRIAEHHMHCERYHIPQTTVDAIEAARQRGGRITAIGTTSLRALEAAAVDGALQVGPAETDIFIAPGFEFHVADRLLTNFHLPRSTLLMLVSAFAGMAPIRAAYRHAVEQRYRFFSYGDAMLIDRM